MSDDLCDILSESRGDRCALWWLRPATDRLAVLTAALALFRQADRAPRSYRH